jgi:hypothetical protein
MSTPEDYYWKYIGKKRFFFRVTTNTVIARRYINPAVIDKIPFRSNDSTINDLVKEKEGIQAEIIRLRARMNTIDARIDRLKIEPSPEEINARKKKEEKKQKPAKKQAKREDWKSWRDCSSGIGTPLSSGGSSDKLAKYNIKTKADWMNWLKVNHPDKVKGSDREVGEVNALASTMGWCN